MKIRQYNITGMSCAACSARVEKAVKAVPGVDTVNVNLLTNSMSVEGKAKDDEIIKAVKAAGYGCEPMTEDYNIKDPDLKVLILRLIFSLIISAVLMFIMLAEKMVPSWLCPALALLVMLINVRFFINGFKGVIHKAPNMDTLVALGSLASFIYGYYDSAAMILALITVGKTLEAYSKGKTTSAIKSLIKLVPKVDIKVGEEFEVKPGESIPADGTVIMGNSAVDEAALTGESIPVDKKEGDTVSAGTINRSGYLRCKATRVGNDTALGQIIKMVSDAASTKAPIAKTADKVAGIFVPVVIGIAVVTFIIWMIADKEIGFALSRAISVLVISCPCALGLATPVAIMVGSGKGAKSGILFKNAVSLEQAGKVNTVVLDKTGTITKGRPVVTDIIDASGKRLDVKDAGKSDLLRLAVSLESKSEHPLAEAVVSFAEKYIENRPLCTDFKALPGNGVSAVYEGKKAYAGSISFISQQISLPQSMIDKANELAESGKTPLAFAVDGELKGLIAVADEIKPESAVGISQLRRMGIKVVMLTGDNERTAKAIADKAGVDEFIAGVLPDEKAYAVKNFKNNGRVMMVGDGINDAPALTVADVGVAISAGTDVAIDAADVVLMKSSMLDVPAAIRLSRKVIRNIHQNLFWAFCYNIIGIPLAAGLFIPITGWQLNPIFCAAAMSISSFIVVTNALRLNLVDIYDSKNDSPLKQKEDRKEKSTDIVKEENKMYKTTVAVEGMMCPMCEKHTNEAIEKAFDVQEVKSDHNAVQTVIISAEKLDEEKLMNTIKEAGYYPGSVKVEMI